jgi:hypothetical protein
MPRFIRSLEVKLTDQRGHWAVELRVDGQIEPSTIFGCRQGFEPILRALATAEAKVTAVSAGAVGDAWDSGPSITVSMPSGRKLTFLFAGGTEAIPDAPQGVSATISRRGDG